MNTVLVTGSNGQLGSEIKKLSAEFKDLNFTFTDVEELDITNLPKLKLFFNNNKVNYIINAAAYTAVDKAENDEKKARLINIEGVTNLTRLASNFQSHLIHISTDYVFDGTSNTPYDEDSKTNPLGVYGKTKLLGEIEALRYVNTIVIRTSWLYSSYGNNFVKNILKYSKEHTELNVVYDQIGSPTYAEDLARAILTIIDQNINHHHIFKRGIYHYANKGVCSWFDIAQNIISFYNLPCRVNPILTKNYPTPAKRPAYSVLNTEKFRTTFKQDIPYWRDSLNKCLTLIKY
ncbi:MAG: dTDP-4-dehydrorhamnose reductase [Bacteroidales bacterium]